MTYHFPPSILAVISYSVVFYTTLKKVVPEDLGKRQIDLLIDEEISHISILTQKRWELGAQKG